MPEPGEDTGNLPLALEHYIRFLCPPLNFYPPNTPPDLFPNAIDYFSSIPWCAELLNAPNTIPFVPQCFNSNSPSINQFIGTTIAVPRGLSHMLCFFRTDDEAHALDPKRPILRASSLFAVGEGLCGYPGILHGGMVMALVDESMGILHELNVALDKEDEIYRLPSVTAGVDIKLLRPTPVDDVVVVEAWLEGVEGRKSTCGCEVRDGKGRVLATCSSKWVAVKAKI